MTEVIEEYQQDKKNTHEYYQFKLKYRFFNKMKDFAVQNKINRISNQKLESHLESKQ